jgi:hypothetical protein
MAAFDDYPLPWKATKPYHATNSTDFSRGWVHQDDYRTDIVDVKGCPVRLGHESVPRGGNPPPRDPTVLAVVDAVNSCARLRKRLDAVRTEVELYEESRKSGVSDDAKDYFRLLEYLTKLLDGAA